MHLSERFLKLLKVRPEEVTTVRLLLALAFFVGLIRVFTVTAGNALFVANVGPEALAFAYICVAFASPLVGIAYVVLQNRLPLRLLVLANFLFVGVVSLGLTLLFPVVDITACSYVALVWWFIAGALIGLAFWDVAGAVVDLRQAKRLYGLLSAGIVAGGFLGGLGIPLLTRLLSADKLLLLSFGSAVGCVLIGERLFRQAKVQAPQPVDSPRRGQRAMAKWRQYFLTVAGLTAAFAFASYLVDRNFLYAVHQQYPQADAAAAFLGVVFGATELLGFLALLFVTGRIMTRFGLGTALAIFPATLGICAAGTMIVLLLPIATAVPFMLICSTKILDQVMRKSLNGTAIQLVYQPLPQQARGALRTLSQVGVSPIVGGLAGVVLILLQRYEIADPLLLSGLLIVVVIPWWQCALAVARQYTRVLAQVLLSRNLAPTELPLRDATSLALLQENLDSPQTAVAMFAVEVLADDAPTVFGQAIDRPLNHPAPEVRRAALQKLEALQLSSASPAIRKRIDAEPVAAIKGQAVRVYLALAAATDDGQLNVWLADPAPEVRCGALAGTLRRNGDLDSRAGRILQELCQAGRPSDRQLAATIIADAAVADLTPLLDQLVNDADLAVRRTAMVAAGRLRAESLADKVIQGLQFEETAHQAIGSLVSYGPPVIPQLEAVCRSGSQMAIVQLRAVRAIAQMSGGESTLALVRLTDSSDRPISSFAIATLFVRQFAADHVVQKHLRRQVIDLVSYAAWLFRVRLDLGDHASCVPVASALLGELRLVRMQLLHCLGCLFSPRSFAHVIDYYVSNARQMNVLALDLIDHLVSHRLRQCVLPVLEPISDAEALERLPGDVVPPPETVAGRLAELIRGDRPAYHLNWLRACAIAASASGPTEKLTALIVEQLDSQDPFVLEAAIDAVRIPAADELLSRRGFFECATDRRVRRAWQQFCGFDEGTNTMYSTISRVMFLKSVDVFSETPDPVLAELANLLELVELSAGETLFHKGDPGTSMYIVVDGQARVHDRETTFAELGPRQIVGEMSAIDPAPRSASVTAIEDTRMFCLEREALLVAINTNPEIGQAMLRVVVRRFRSVRGAD